jgi:hypothetical protein
MNIKWWLHLGVNETARMVFRPIDTDVAPRDERWGTPTTSDARVGRQTCAERRCDPSCLHPGVSPDKPLTDPGRGQKAATPKGHLRRTPMGSLAI